MRVLITGGAGFIGYHLTKRLLKEGYEIDLVDNLSRGIIDNELKQLIDNRAVKFVDVNLLHPECMEKLKGDYSCIYHFAAIIGVSNVLKKPFSVLRDNALMLINILDFAKTISPLKRFVFTSTSEVYAGTLQNFELPIPTPESTPLALTALDHPRTSYMLSKIYGEALLNQADIPFTIVRPHNVYGPRMGMAHVIPELLKRAYLAKNGNKLDVFSVNHRRTFCYVDDFIETIKFASELPDCNGQTLNIGNQSPEVTIEELAKLVIYVTGRNLTINPQQATSGSPVRRCPDMTKTLKLINYTPEVSIEKGIELTFEWYKKNVFNAEKN